MLGSTYIKQNPFGASTDTTASPGAATVTTRRGRSSVADGSQTVTLTHARVTATAQIKIMSQTNTGIYIRSVEPAAGSFLVRLNQALSGFDLDFSWLIVSYS